MIANSIRLSEADEQHLAAFNHLLNLVKARVTGVALKKHVGVYISGRAGTSKTFTVEECLTALHVNYQKLNCRVSPGGLYDTLRDHPEDTIVLEDVNTLWKHPQGLQVFLAALDGHAGEARKITYVLKGEQKEPSFEFLGGIIAMSNRPLQRDPVADAVASRIRLLEHNPTDEMIASFMRHLAIKGFLDMTAEECWGVVEYVIALSKRCEYRLDLRHWEHGCQDYRLWRDDQSHGIGWKELIASSMQQIVREDEILDAPISKADDLKIQRSKVHEAIELFPKDRQKQIEHSGLAVRTFDRRVAEVKRLK